MLLGGRDSIVVEVVNNDSRAITGEVDIDLEEEGADGAGGGGLAGEGEEDVAVLVQEFQDALGGQVGAETCMYQPIAFGRPRRAECLPLDFGGRIRRWS